MTRMTRKTRKADFGAKRAQRALAALTEAYNELAEVTPALQAELDRISDAMSAVREAGARLATEAGWTAEDLREAGF